MAKPIFIIRLPIINSEQDNKLIANSLIKGMKKIKDEYHIVFVFSEYTEEAKFELYNSESYIPPITIEELQEKLLNIK